MKSIKWLINGLRVGSRLRYKNRKLILLPLKTTLHYLLCHLCMLWFNEEELVRNYAYAFFLLCCGTFKVVSC